MTGDKTLPTSHLSQAPPELAAGGRVGALLLVDRGALLPALGLSEAVRPGPHRGLDQVAGPAGGEDLRHRPGHQAGQQEHDQHRLAGGTEAGHSHHWEHWNNKWN